MPRLKIQKLLVFGAFACCIYVMWDILFSYIGIPHLKKTPHDIKYTGFTYDPEQYKFIINHPKACMLENTLIFMVHSACQNYRRRHNIRKTWGTVKESRMFNIKYLFVLGFLEKYQESVLKENNMYGDIIQQDFIDSYRNLTLKNQMALKWPSIYCKTAQFIVKLDDDVMVNIHRLTQFLRQQTLVQNFLFCHVFYNATPYRHAVYPYNGNKWALTYEEYPWDTFPPYCRGTAYILSPDVAVKLWKGSYAIPPLFIDDVFMTGLVREHMNINIKHELPMYRMDPIFLWVYRGLIDVTEGLFFYPGNDIQLFNWDFVWEKIVKSTAGIL